jgi:SAM-dependent methyltransferase
MTAVSSTQGDLPVRRDAKADAADAAKRDVHDFWNQASCGERLYLSSDDLDGYDEQSRIRYRLEPWIAELARFDQAAGKDLLEIGVGLGADHQRFAQAGARPAGIDLTERAVEHTRRRLRGFGLSSALRIGDAEHLPFPDDAFDIVYSWGVLHHSPDTAQAVSEVRRVLRPGGSARVMIYHKWSLVGVMLWLRYALVAMRPFRSLSSVYAEHLESPGTKAYTVAEARALFAGFRDVQIRTVLTHADLLESQAGQRHNTPLLASARRLWPRWLLRRTCQRLGLFMLIEATK